MTTSGRKRRPIVPQENPPQLDRRPIGLTPEDDGCINLRALKLGQRVFYKAYQDSDLHEAMVGLISDTHLMVSGVGFCGHSKLGLKRFDLKTGLEDSAQPGTLWTSLEAYHLHLKNGQRKFELEQKIYYALGRISLPNLEAIVALIDEQSKGGAK